MSNAAQSETDSSVVFNLRQLMRLEEERVACEEAALRRARAAEEQARLEGLRLAREAAEREARAVSEAAERKAQSEREAAERAEAERAAALLRVQLEAAAVESAGEQRVHELHAREVVALHADAAQRRFRTLIGAGVTFAVIIAVASTGQWLAAQRTAEARSAAQAASTLAAAQARELAELRARLTSPKIEPAPSAANTPPAPATAPVTQQAQRRVRATRTQIERQSTKSREKQAAPDLDLNEDGRDPIEGL